MLIFLPLRIAGIARLPFFAAWRKAPPPAPACVRANPSNRSLHRPGAVFLRRASARRCAAGLALIVSPRPAPKAASSGEPRDLLLGRAPGNHQAVQLLIVSRFDQQRGFDHGDGVRLGLLDGGKFPVLRGKHVRMHDGVQSRQALRIGKHDCAELLRGPRGHPATRMPRPNSRTTSS